MRDKSDTKMVWGERGYFAFFCSFYPLTSHHPLFSLPSPLIPLFASYKDNGIKKYGEGNKDSGFETANSCSIY